MNKEKAYAFSGFGAIRQEPVAVKDRRCPARVFAHAGFNCSAEMRDGLRRWCAKRQ
jgi:hypothetical protein